MDYKTTDMYLATFLMTKGFRLKNYEYGKPKGIFVFQLDDDIKQAEHDYYFAPEDDISVMVNAKKHIENIDKLKQIIHSTNHYAI